MVNYSSFGSTYIATATFLDMARYYPSKMMLASSYTQSCTRLKLCVSLSVAVDQDFYKQLLVAPTPVTLWDPHPSGQRILLPFQVKFRGYARFFK